MSMVLKPYEGKRPYIFISYPHKESETVVETIRILYEKRYRLWYDEGIPAGSDWPANIARHMQDCQAVICFISNHFLRSHNCFSEVRAARQLGKPILAVYLEDCVLPQEWKPLLENCKTIPVIPGPRERARAILGASFLRRRFRRTWRERIPWRFLGFVTSLLLFLSSGAALWAVVTGRVSVPQQTPQPAPVVQQTPQTAPVVIVDLGEAEKYFSIEFPDSQQERAIRDALGMESEAILAGDLTGIKTLYFCGNMILRDTSGVAFETDGSCRVNGAPVVTGAVSDLEVIGKLVYLEQLALICQPVTELEELNHLVLLRELNLAGSGVKTLDSLGELPSLEILHLEHTAVRDLRPLERQPGLRTVTVSLDMLPLTWNVDSGFEIVLVK